MKKDELFEPYYELGFNHFINKNLLGLKRTKTITQRFYFILIILILSISMLTN